MSSGRSGSRGIPDTVNDMAYVEPGAKYQRLIIENLAESQLISSLVCNGAIPMRIERSAEPCDELLGRNLIKSYVSDAYNAVCDHYVIEQKYIEHCMYRTIGELGYVMDYVDRVWPENSAGAYMTVAASVELRRVVLDTTDQLLSEENEVRPVQKAFLDALLLPLVQSWNGAELSCETMMYVSTTFEELKKYMATSDLALVKSALSKVERPCESGGDHDATFTSNLLGVIAAELGLPTPDYMLPDGRSRAYADIVRMADTSRNDWFLKNCLRYKLWIDHVNNRNQSGLLIGTLLDMYMDWGGGNAALDEFVNELLENEWALPQPIDIHNVEHRAVTTERILGVSSITESITVKGGKLVAAEFGEITTQDLSGRQTGTVDKRRTVVYFDENKDIVVQFKNARNYFLNILYYARPGKFARTEVREAVVDRDKLVGLPAMYVLLRGQTNVKLARFMIAALTFKAVSVKRRADNGIAEMFGTKEGKYDFQGIASPSMLAAFPTLLDSKKRLYLYHDGATYRAKCRGLEWSISREDMKEEPVGFGTLATAFPMKSRRASRSK